MSVKTRLLALKLLEKQERHPEFAKKIGVKVDVVNKQEHKLISKCKSYKEEKQWKHSKSTTQ